MSFIHGVGAAFKATVFLIALYLWGALFPSILCFDVIGRWFGDILFGGLLNGLNVWVLRGTLLLLCAAWITFFLRSRFFLQVRQWLKPVWLSAVLLWLIPFVATLAIASEKGHELYGFPIPFLWDLMKPWPAYFGLLLPQMAIMLCVFVIVCIISRLATHQHRSVVRLMILMVFSGLCIWSSHLCRVHFFSPPWRSYERMAKIPLYIFTGCSLCSALAGYMPCSGMARYRRANYFLEK